MLFGSTCPLRVRADQTHPSSGLSAAFQRVSSTARTRVVIGSTLRAAVVLPLVTRRTPLRPLSQVTCSHRSWKHSSGRVPVSANNMAIDRSGSDETARYLVSSSLLTTRSRRRSPDMTWSFGAIVITPHSTPKFRTRRRTRIELFTVAICIPCRIRHPANSDTSSLVIPSKAVLASGLYSPRTLHSFRYHFKSRDSSSPR
jgi:hypothetical protein